MDANERIRYVLEDIGMSGLALTRFLGINENTIRSITGGKVKKISHSLAEGIVEKFPQYNKLWLLTGEGDIYVQDENLAPEKNENNYHINEILTVCKTLADQVVEAQQLLRNGQRILAKSQQQFDIMLRLYEQMQRRSNIGFVADDEPKQKDE